MVRLLLFLCTVFINAGLFAHTINWYIDDSLYTTTTCESGDDITPPTAPARHGYVFKGWEKMYTPIEYLKSDGVAYIDTGIYLAVVR